MQFCSSDVQAGTSVLRNKDACLSVGKYVGKHRGVNKNK